METNFKICASCLQDGENVLSSEWCWDCMEGLCTECAKYHRKQKPSRQHKIVVLNNITNFDLLLSYIKNSCPIHNNQPLLLFCATHRELCCKLCVETSHLDCQQLITLTEAVTTTTNDDVTEKFKSLEQLLEIKTETIRKSLVSQGEEVVQKVQQIRKEIDKYFDKLEEEVKKHLIVKHESYLKLVHQENYSVEECCNEIKIMKEFMGGLSDDIPSEISFQVRNEMIKKLQNHNNKFSSSTKQAFQFLFKPVDVMSALETHVKSLGEICITQISDVCHVSDNQIPCKKTNEIKYDRKSLQSESTDKAGCDTKCETTSYDGSEDKEKKNTNKGSSEKLKKTLATGDQKSQNDRKKISEMNVERKTEKASLTHILQLSVLGSNVTSTECCYLPDGKLVLIDSTGKFVMSCNDKGRQLKKVSLAQEPLDISVYDNTRLIVALGMNGIQSLNIVSLRPLGKVINLGGKCTAVTHDNEQVIVAVDDKLKLITIDGKLIRHIDHPGLVWSLSAVFNGKIYYSDFFDDDDVLHCINLDGTNIFSYQHPELIGPTGVAVDTHGNVYVAGLSSNNVHQLSGDGTLLSIILTKKDGIKYPRGMAYNREKRELLLINQDRKIIQFYAIH
ncbi:tripartite motif-containing protein 2-like [Mytilus trossulus]|uniref:tripartite motif-containing protein 2-like n=1 Tax=Mytilus trossulus TaxID=6551 RepID=UPI003006E562